MKKNKTMRLAAILLVCVLLTTSVISGTFAKYTSQASAYDTARVAKWDIQLNGESIAENKFKFDLFDTVNGAGAGDETGNDLHVKDGTDVAIIAPGTSGSFAIELQNKSEVTAAYTIDYTVFNPAGIPVKFSVDGTTWGDLADVTDPVVLAMDASATTVNVQWKWDFDGTRDAADTALGLRGADTITVTAAITVNQVN